MSAFASIGDVTESSANNIPHSTLTVSVTENTRFASSLFRFPSRIPAATLPPTPRTYPGISMIWSTVIPTLTADMASAPRILPTSMVSTIFPS